MAQTRIGISGWTYTPWRGTFYPPKWPQKRELEYASGRLNSIEINGSFYSLQTPKSYRAWRDATPDDFVFAVKGGRFITHMRRLKDVEVPLATFLASGLLALGPKLGPILWQFPPTMKLDVPRFEAFFDLLPRTTADAARLARRHDPRMKAPLVEAESDRPMRYAVEVRHASFRDATFVRLLRKYGVALVVADTAGKWPQIEDVTADFVYVRLHGDEELYVSGYTDAALDRWAEKVRAWRAGRDAPGAVKVLPEVSPPGRRARDVFVYFDNDVKVRAPFDAIALAHRLKGTKGPAPAAPDLTHVTETARTHWPAVGTSRAKVTRRPKAGARRA
jgi:uncharacterized protein YecE (DUF72 family)